MPNQIFIFCPFSTAAQIKKIANAEIHEPPKFDNDTYNYPTTIATDQEPIKIIPKTNITTTYELRKCLSGDETLMLSAAENPDLLSGNETLINLPNNEDGEASDEEIDDIEMEDDNNDIGKDDVMGKKVGTKKKKFRETNTKLISRNFLIHAKQYLAILGDVFCFTFKDQQCFWKTFRDK